MWFTVVALLSFWTSASASYSDDELALVQKKASLLEESSTESSIQLDVSKEGGVDFTLNARDTYWRCPRRGVGNHHGCNAGSLEQCALKVKNDPACSYNFDYNPSWCGGQCKCVVKSQPACAGTNSYGGYNTYKINSAPAAEAVDGVFENQKVVTRGSDIRGIIPRVSTMRACLCDASKRADIAAVNYDSSSDICVLLKAGTDTTRREASAGWQTATQFKCEKELMDYKVPKTCAGLKGLDHAKCAKIRGEAAYISGSWINKQKCLATVSTNPKMYDWNKAKEYCLKGNSYCNGIAKLTVKKNGKYVNEYTFCKAWQGRFMTENLPATWPYGGVIEVKHKSTVQLDKAEMDLYR